jgi:hypothetical protein
MPTLADAASQLGIRPVALAQAIQQGKGGDGPRARWRAADREMVERVRRSGGRRARPWSAAAAPSRRWQDATSAAAARAFRADPLRYGSAVRARWVATLGAVLLMVMFASGWLGTDRLVAAIRSGPPTYYVRHENLLPGMTLVVIDCYGTRYYYWSPGGPLHISDAQFLEAYCSSPRPWLAG